jgi:hypothetical protein
MKIGFDIHGVIDKNPKLFSELINTFREKGYEIHILTGSLISKELLDELDSYEIKYDKLFSILEYHKSTGTKMWEDERGWWIDQDVWDKTKGEYCEKNNIKFHIDDTRIYGKYFMTPFGHITPIKENPRILEICGDVDDDILVVFKQHEGYYKMKFV